MSGHGFLNIHKPAGCTSRDAVNRVVRRTRQKRCGHAGTLDPLATGVLVIALGPATRLVEYVQDQTKRYRAVFQLGLESDTDDVEGNVVVVPVERPPRRDEVEQVLAQFVGTIEQRPPAYSAIKVQGKRAYDLARKGNVVELAARPVYVESIVIESYAYPRLEVTITCGSGTYIRSIGRDAGKLLGTGAVMSDLVRTAVGSFTLETALTLEQLEALAGEEWHAAVLPYRAGLASLPSWRVPEELRVAFLHGQKIQVADLAEQAVEKELAVYDQKDQFLGIAVPLDRDTLRLTKGGFV